MPIPNFDFPGVTLTQNFEPTIANTVSDMSVACVGQQYKTHRADVASEAAKIDQSENAYSSESGLSGVVLPGLISKDNIDTELGTQRVVIKNGYFSYCTLAANSLIDADFADNIITFDTPVKSSDIYESDNAFLTRDAAIGDTVCIRYNNSTVFATIVNILEEEGKGYTKIQIDSFGSDIIKGEDKQYPSIKVSFCLPHDTVLNPDEKTFNINKATGLLTLASSIKVEIPSLTNTSATFEKGDIYVEYRERSDEYAGKLGSVGSVSDIEATVGSIHAENPLAVALYFALAASAGNIIYFTGVKSNTRAGYEEALDYLEKYSNIYSIVLDTEDSEIILGCGGSVIKTSEDKDSKVRRTLWYAISEAKELVLEHATATTEAVEVGGSVTEVVLKFNKNVFAGKGYADNGVINDIIYDVKAKKEYTIKKTNKLNTAYVDASMPISNGAVEFKLIRKNPANSDLISDLISKRVVSSYKAQCVFGDGVIYNGERVGNYALAAAAAGMRSGEYCHRPLSNLSYNFFTLEESHGFTRAQLKELGANGVWIIGNNNNGIPSNLRQVTSAASGDVNRDEESIVANADNIALAVANLGGNIVGNSNITDALVSSLAQDLTNILDSKSTNESGNIYIGPQLISYTIDSVYQDPVNLDHIYAIFTVEPPRPFNKFSMAMRIL